MQIHFLLTYLSVNIYGEENDWRKWGAIRRLIIYIVRTISHPIAPRSYLRIVIFRIYEKTLRYKIKIHITENTYYKKSDNNHHDRKYKVSNKLSHSDR